MASSTQKDCLSCRALGTLVGVGAGLYVAFHAPAKGLQRWGMLSVASALGALGLARGFNVAPFGGMFKASEPQDA